MPSKIQVAAFVGALASSVNAHGHLSKITVDGEAFIAYDPSFQYQTPVPEVIEWSCPECLDNGFVDPSLYTDVTKYVTPVNESHMRYMTDCEIQDRLPQGRHRGCQGREGQGRRKARHPVEHLARVSRRTYPRLLGQGRRCYYRQVCRSQLLQDRCNWLRRRQVGC
jgi:hypothetical protein